MQLCPRCLRTWPDEHRYCPKDGELLAPADAGRAVSNATWDSLPSARTGALPRDGLGQPAEAPPVIPDPSPTFQGRRSSLRSAAAVVAVVLFGAAIAYAAFRVMGVVG